MKRVIGQTVRCAIYTRVSTDAGLDQDFNSLDAQYDAAQAYIRSQAHAGWALVRTRYDDGGFSGGSTDRPALQQLLADIKAHRVNVIVVYKVDRLTHCIVLKQSDGPSAGEQTEAVGVLGCRRANRADKLKRKPPSCSNENFRSSKSFGASRGEVIPNQYQGSLDFL